MAQQQPNGGNKEESEKNAGSQEEDGPRFQKGADDLDQLEGIEKQQRRSRKARQEHEQMDAGEDPDPQSTCLQLAFVLCDDSLQNAPRGFLKLTPSKRSPTSFKSGKHHFREGRPSPAFGTRKQGSDELSYLVQESDAPFHRVCSFNSAEQGLQSLRRSVSKEPRQEIPFRFVGVIGASDAIKHGVCEWRLKIAPQNLFCLSTRSFENKGMDCVVAPRFQKCLKFEKKRPIVVDDQDQLAELEVLDQ